MSRKVSKEARVVRNLRRQQERPELKVPIATGMFIPNHSGDHSAGRVLTTPTTDQMIANKAYVDSVSSGAPEGTAVKSTGEAGGTKFLREDGDGTCSWQAATGAGDALTTDPLSQFAATTSLQLKGVISDETGSGALVFATSPTLVTPALGTPASGTLTNCTFPTLNQDTTGTAATVTTNANLTGHVTSTGNAAVLGSFTSLQLKTALTNETGSGAAVFATSPTLVTPALGTPASGDLSNCTGIPGPEGTAVLSTGEAGGSKFLREDGDGTCSWQAIAGGGDLLAANNLSDVANAATSFSNIKQAATTTATGVMEIALSSEVDTGTDNTRAITPSALAGSALQTKVDGIEASADVTDTANVTSAGALMDSEVDADIKTLSLPASTTISAFGATLVDDASASAARTTLGVDAAGTDNSTDVTLAGTPDYITITGQVITRGTIDIGDDTNFTAGTNCTLVGDTLNVDDAFIKNDADDTSTGKITAANFAVTGDNNTGDTTYVPMVLHGTDATPPTASTVPRGTIYVQYTA